MRFWFFSTPALALWFSVASPVFASGYHYQVDASSQLIEDSAGNLGSLKVSWLYDRPVSFLLYDDIASSQVNRARDLARLAEGIMDDLKEYGYYAVLEVDGESQAFNAVTDYQLVLNKNRRLQLDFTLSLTEPVALAGKQAEFKWWDSSGTGLVLYPAATDFSLGSMRANCSVELENFPDAEHGELSQVVRLQCQ